MIEQMHPRDLKTIWQCRECGRNFVFYSDVEFHKAEFNHSKMISLDFPARRGSKAPAGFIRGQTKLAFRLPDGATARVMIEYKYYPSSDDISYVGVTYSDKRLEYMIEGNPRMIRNIDSYLRRRLICQSDRSVGLK
jgi:hypothetical protein